MSQEHIAVGFLSVFTGGIITTAGITGSSIHSIIQGKPDHSRQSESGSPTTSTSTTANIQGNATQHQFAVSLLKSVGVQPSKQAVNNLIAWENAEGGNWNNNAKYNPLNTTLKTGKSNVMAGGSSAGVQSYENWNEGLAATVNTLRNYPQIIRAFSQPFNIFQKTVSESPWGTWK